MNHEHDGSNVFRLLATVGCFGIIACSGCATHFETVPQQDLKMRIRIDWTEPSPFPWAYNGGVLMGRVSLVPAPVPRRK